MLRRLLVALRSNTNNGMYDAGAGSHYYNIGIPNENNREGTV
ncbi:MAG: hypothetical protein AAFQ98_02265 [Bacteroidota bacterium]